MTPNAPTWGEVEQFYEADGWRPVQGGERTGGRQRHIFYEKVLPDGRVLQSHISHAREKTMSAGRFSAILRYELEVSKDEFWDCLRTGQPVDRPVSLDEPEVVEHEAWVLAVLAGELHMPAEEIERLSKDEAQALVLEHWSRPRD